MIQQQKVRSETILLPELRVAYCHLAGEQADPSCDAHPGALLDSQPARDVVQCHSKLSQLLLAQWPDQTKANSSEESTFYSCIARSVICPALFIMTQWASQDSPEAKMQGQALDLAQRLDVHNYCIAESSGIRGACAWHSALSPSFLWHAIPFGTGGRRSARPKRMLSPQQPCLGHMHSQTIAGPTWKRESIEKCFFISVPACQGCSSGQMRLAKTIRALFTLLFPWWGG